MLSKIEEIALVARCVASDDRRAFARIVNEYAPAVRNFLFRLTGGDAALTDDLSQDTFVKAWSGLKSLRAAARLRTWLFSIAYNEFVSFTRRQREERMPEEYVPPAGEGLSDHGAKLSEMRHDINVALASLTPKERTVVVLFYLDDLPIKDISRITSLPSGTIKSYLSRAKNKMAEMLKNDEK